MLNSTKQPFKQDIREICTLTADMPSDMSTKVWSETDNHPAYLQMLILLSNHLGSCKRSTPADQKTWTLTQIYYMLRLDANFTIITFLTCFIDYACRDIYVAHAELFNKS